MTGNLRYVVSVLPAIVVTYGLFMLMNALVGSEKVELSNIESTRIVPPVSKDNQDDVKKKEREAEKPPEVAPPPPEIDLQKQNFKPNQSALNIGQNLGGFDVSLGGIGLGAVTDGEYLPIFKVPPEYPRRAAERGIQGYVIVQFTVTEEGTVEDVEVVEADPKGYFERAAVKAASKFRYKPKVVNGQPIRVEGVPNKITFNLAE